MINPKISRTLEELMDIDYELKYVPGKDNVVADTLSRSLVKADEHPMDSKEPIVPPGTSVVTVPGGGNSLFQCFSLFLHGTIDKHLELRVEVIDYLIKNRKEFNLPTGKSHVEVTRKLQLLK